MKTSESCEGKYTSLSRGNIELLSYVSLSEAQLEKVLDWRNDPSVNKWLIDKNPITWEKHLLFVDKLRSNSDTYYWLVKHLDAECGVVSLHLDPEAKSGMPGIFMAPEYLEFGIGIEVAFEFTHILFEQLGLQRSYGPAYIENSNAINMNRMLGYSFTPSTSSQEIVDVQLDYQDYLQLPKTLSAFIRKNRSKQSRQVLD